MGCASRSRRCARVWGVRQSKSRCGLRCRVGVEGRDAISNARQGPRGVGITLGSWCWDQLLLT
eukprot:244029-Chlamydomonas_euryale.AAC.1